MSVLPTRLITLGVKSGESLNRKSEMSFDRYITRMVMIMCPIQKGCLIFVVLIPSREHRAGKERHQSKVNNSIRGASAKIKGSFQPHHQDQDVVLPIRLSKKKTNPAGSTAKVTDFRFLNCGKKVPNAGGLERLTILDGVKVRTWVTTGKEEPALKPVAVILQAAARATRPCWVGTSQPYQTLLSENDLVVGPRVNEKGGAIARATFGSE